MKTDSVCIYIFNSYTMATSGMMLVLKDGTVLRDREAFLHQTTVGSFVWSFFETEVISTFRGTTKREWLDRWDAFIGEKIESGWQCELVGVNPYWRGKVGKVSSIFKMDS